jgi:hypothetical protein
MASAGEVGESGEDGNEGSLTTQKEKVEERKEANSSDAVDKKRIRSEKSLLNARSSLEKTPTSRSPYSQRMLSLDSFDLETAKSEIFRLQV